MCQVWGRVAGSSQVVVWHQLTFFDGSHTGPSVLEDKRFALNDPSSFSFGFPFSYSLKVSAFKGDIASEVTMLSDFLFAVTVRSNSEIQKESRKENWPQLCQIFCLEKYACPSSKHAFPTCWH